MGKGDMRDTALIGLFERLAFFCRDQGRIVPGHESLVMRRMRKWQAAVHVPGEEREGRVVVGLWIWMM